MATFLLVHGAWHGAWCWNKVVPLLEASGHKVQAIDLPGHGSDQTPPGNVTLDLYVRKVCSVLDGEAAPAIVVGHSMGGTVITQTAEERPERINRLVYVSAFLPANGQSLLDLTGADRDTLVMPNLVPSADGVTVTLKEDLLKDIFYHDCSDADIAFARERLDPQPAAPFATPVHTTDGNFGRVPRAYIECLQDHAISAPIQKQMYTALPCDPVITMNTSHSPFLSAPEELARHLLSLA